MLKREVIALLIVSIIAAVFLRAQHMGNDVKSWQVGNTIMLTTLEIWNHDGIADHYFSPVQTWPNEGDKFRHQYKRIEDHRGNNYYVSLPPMAWWIAHSCFQAIGKPPTQIGLQIIGLAIQILGAFAVLGFFLSYFKSIAGGITGFLLFLFYPMLAFGFNYNFFSEIIGLSFWAISAFLAVRSLNRGRDHWPWLLAFGSLLFILTCWTGVFFSFGTILYFMLRNRWKTATLLGASAVAGVAIILVCYGSISGLDDLYHSWKIRFYERSGLFEKHLSDQGLNISNVDSYRLVFERFQSHLKWSGYACLLGYLVVLGWLRFGKKTVRPRSITPLIFLFIIPAFLHLFIFLNANSLHFVYQGKWALLIVLLGGWTIYRLGLDSSKTPQRIGFALISLSLLFSLEMMQPEDTQTERLRNLANEIRPVMLPGKPISVEANQGINTLYLGYLLKRNVTTENQTD